MSDYLWDRSGEPEAEVERLEELLGRLRHTRGAPELPSELETHASRLGVEVERAGLFGHALFSRPARLAAAAALLLAALAGALVMLRPSKENVRDASSASRAALPQAGAHEEVRVPEQSRSPEEVRAPEGSAPPSEQSAAQGKSTYEHARRGELAAAKAFQKLRSREVAPREVAAGGQLQRAFKPALTRGEGFEGGATNLQSRVRAKEQLVYALRLTSEALKEVRGKALWLDARGNAFDGRSPLR